MNLNVSYTYCAQSVLEIGGMEALGIGLHNKCIAPYHQNQYWCNIWMGRWIENTFKGHRKVLQVRGNVMGL